jgi:hypothetical protein
VPCLFSAVLVVVARYVRLGIDETPPRQITPASGVVFGILAFSFHAGGADRSLRRIVLIGSGLALTWSFAAVPLLDTSSPLLFAVATFRPRSGAGRSG